MMNGDVDDDEEEEETILDRRDLIHKANNSNLSSNSGSILLGLNQYNIRIYDDPNKVSYGKIILLATTCISIGMFTGLLGPTFPFLAQTISTELSSVIWLIAIKAFGFLLGTFLSSYLYTWFNVCCLLGLSCLSISFGVCSLPFITDLTAFYLASLILGIGLALSYNGIDALYNCLCTRPPLSSIRWLHLLVALGAILSTLMLLPSMASNDNLFATNITKSPRLRREIMTGQTRLFNLSTTTRIITPFVEVNNLTTESSSEGEEVNTKLIHGNSSTMTKLSTNSSSTQSNFTPFTSISIIKNSSRTIHRNKPAMAESDLSENLLHVKLHLFFLSLTSIHLLYLFLAFTFFLLGIFYSILAIRGVGLNPAAITNLNPLSLLFVKSHRTVSNSHSQISLLSDRSSLKFVCLLMLFYFILSGIESSCTYLTYLFGVKLKFQETKSLLVQFFYLSGRLLDILFNYGWYLFNKYLKNQSDIISIKVSILIRLIILFLISLSSLFQQEPSIQTLYFLFFLIGFSITSLPSLILYWIERDLSLNNLLLRLILFTIIISEIIFPTLLFYKIESIGLFYLFIASCLLIILFLSILYISKKWQRNRSYRLIPTSMEMNGMELQENSDNENENEINLDNERSKGLKLH